jgi:predicted molibdopterin-dependent oxidoreductase YjgC
MSLQITIDGRSLCVEAGQTVLQAARENGIEIPTLCNYPGLTSHGSCRLCIVDVEGRPNMPTACTTPVEDGMIVHTDTPQVHAMRMELFKLLLSEHPASCLFCEEKSHCDECMVTLRKTGVTTGCRSCPDDGMCELQTLADRFHLTEGGYPVRYRMLPVEKMSPFFDRDYNLCILCERCVRVCGETHFSSVVALTKRGTNTVVGTSFGRSLLQAGCHFCGACVEVCPTGTLSEKSRKWSGIPEHEVSTTCPLCSVGCQMRLLVRNDMVIGSLPDHANGTDMLCVKGRFGITELVNHPQRLQQPTVVSQEGSIPVSWEKAIETAAEKISACDPQKYGLVLSADCSSETLYVAQKFARQVVRSSSVYLSSAADYGHALPVIERLYRASSPLSALSTADTILCLGFDGQYAQSVVETELHYAKRKGTKLITFDTQNYNLRKSSDEWLQPAAGEEADLLEMLVENVRVQAESSQLWPIPPQAQHSTRLLMESKNPLILIGSSFLAGPDNVFRLRTIEKLMVQLHAQVILLPEQVNLGGALQMRITTPLSTTMLQNLEVLHLIGEALPEHLSLRPFVLFQNMYPPASALCAGLMLPAAAFTEEDGMFTDHAGQMRRIHKAVPAPGSALPSWQILCRIAQKLEVPGFEYENEAQIQAEMESIRLPGAEPEEVLASLFRPGSAVFPSSTKEDHGYMGHPLQTWVPGLQGLDPESTLKIK